MDDDDLIPLDGTSAKPTLATVPTHIWRGHGERNPYFTGRDQALNDLAQRLGGREQSHVQAIVGFGGIGKTQLASEYAWRYRHNYRIVWWLPADDPTTLALAFAEVAKQLKIDDVSWASLDAIRHELRRVLGQRSDWLLIFDNAPSADAVRDFFPLPCNGHVLITSRDTDWEGVAQSYPLRQMERSESIAFLKRRVPRADANAVLQRVAQALGDHPLALEQASAHVIESRIDFATYLKRFESHWAELLAEGVSHVTPGAEYPDSLAMSLELSFRQLSDSNSQTLALLNLCSYFAGEIIPSSLLDSAAIASGQLPVDLISVLVDPGHRAAALTQLRRYSLVEGDDEHLHIHRLVSLLVRRRLSLVERNEYAAIALTAVADAFNFDSQDPQTWAACNIILPHALAAAANAESEEVELESASKLFNLAGRLMMKQNQLAEARDALSRALEIAKRIHGPNHARLSVLSNDLGRVLQKLGDSVSAREHFEKALQIDEKIYGGNDVHLTSAVNNHAITLHSDGDFAAARQRLEQALATAEFHYGDEDRRVALIRNNLACVLRDSGDIAGAQTQFERALEQARSAAGDGAPLVAQIAFNLGEMQHHRGDLLAALPLLEMAMQIDASNHAADHPDVIRDARELAALRRQLGLPVNTLQPN